MKIIRLLSRKALFLLLTITIIVFFISYGLTKPSSPIIVYNLVVFIVLTIALFKEHKKTDFRTKSYVKLEYVFTVFYFMILYEPYIGYLFGGEIRDCTWLNRQYLEKSNEAISASTVGFISFLLGIKHDFKFTSHKSRLKDDIKTSYIINWISLLGSIYYGYFYLPLALMQIGTRYATQTFENAIDNEHYFFLRFFLTILSITVCYRNLIINRFKLNFLLIICTSVWLFFTVVILLTGDRSAFMSLIFPTAFIVTNYVWDIKLKYFLVGTLSIFALYQFIENYRMIEGDFSIKAYWEMKEDRDIKRQGDTSFNITTTVTRTAMDYADNHEYTYGKFLSVALLRMIPHGISNVYPNEKYVTSSALLTDIHGAPFGLGSSIVAESYIEFGLIGIVLILYLIGLMCSFLFIRVKQNPTDFVFVVLYLMMFSLVAILPRYTPALIVRGPIWAFLLVVFVRNIVKITSK